MSAARILVVDDEPINLEIVAEYFADEPGFTVATAESGEAAWSLLEREPYGFDVILLDRMMPGLDGIGLLQRIKNTPKTALLPVILQTAASSPDQISEGLKAGAYYYLTKPYRRDALLAIVHAALSDTQTQNQLQRQLSEHIGVLQYLDHGRFLIRTVAEAGQLAAFVAHACPNPEVAVLGISELLVNGIEHGNLGISYTEKARLKLADTWQDEIERRLTLVENQHKRVCLEFTRHPHWIELQVTDQGAGFDWQKYMEIDPERACDPNGRGIALARLLSFSAIRYEGCGNRVVATIETQPGQTASR